MLNQENRKKIVLTKEEEGEMFYFENFCLKEKTGEKPE